MKLHRLKGLIRRALLRRFFSRWNLFSFVPYSCSLLYQILKTPLGVGCPVIFRYKYIPALFPKNDWSFFGTNTSQHDFAGSFFGTNTSSTIFLLFTTQRALIFDRHTTLASRARSSQDGAARRTAGESSSGQCAAAHGRPRAVCNPATAAWSERTADWPSPERTSDGPSPAGSASQCSAVIVWGEQSARWSIRSLRETTAADSAVQSRLSADHATAVKWSHAHARMRARTRAQLAQLEFPDVLHVLHILHVLHALQHPAVRGHFSTLQQQHGPIYTHACARAHTTPLAQLV